MSLLRKSSEKHSAFRFCKQIGRRHIFRPVFSAFQQKKPLSGFSISISSSANLRGNWHRCVSAGCRVSQGPVPQPLLISPLFTSCSILQGKQRPVNKKYAPFGNSRRLYRELPKKSRKTSHFTDKIRGRRASPHVSVSISSFHAALAGLVEGI